MAEAGAMTAVLARRHGVSEATIYNWKAKYEGLELSKVRRLRELESDHARLKLPLADVMLDQACHCRSEWRACRVIDADRKSVRYRSVRDDGAALREKLRELANQRWSMSSYCPVPGVGPMTPANNDYQAGFAAGLMLKDLRLAMEAASKAGAKVELGEHARAIYEVFAKDHAATDFSGVIRTL